MKHHKLTKDTRAGRPGEYYARIRIRGVSKRFKLGTKDKRQADENLRNIEKKILTGMMSFAQQQTTQVVTADGSRDMRIEELVVRHLEWVKANRTEGTFNNRKIFVNQFLEFIRNSMPQGSCMVSSITRQSINDFYVWARTHHGRGANGGNEALVSVKAMFNWAVENEVCDHNIKAFPKIKREMPETRRFTDEELQKLLATAPDDFRDMIELGVLTGLRPKELRMLTWENLRTDNDGDLYLHIVHHKTSKTARISHPRTVPLGKRAQEICRRQKALHPESDFVFLHTRGGAYSNSVLSHTMRRWCKSAGLKNRSSYGLRHTFGTKQGVCKTNQAVIAQLMGHSSIMTTTRYMANVSEAHKQAVNELEKNLEFVLSPASSDAKPPQKLSRNLSRTNNGGLNSEAANNHK